MTQQKLTFLTWIFVVITVGASLFSGVGRHAGNAELLNAQSTPESLEANAALTEGAVFQAALAITAAYGHQDLAAQLTPAHHT